MEQQAVRKITIIPPYKVREQINRDTVAFLRVAAYCRVSTESEEQESSYKFQVEYYTQHIKKHPDWQLADIYADDGKSGKSDRNRKDFMRMIDDCRAGKIDKIITKSVSRFARNLMLCKKYVLELKELGIPVVFEKENIDSMQAGSDLILSILATVSEQESRDISTNVKWTLDKKRKKGEVSLNTKRFLGYTKDEDKNYIIVPEEAEIVKRIYCEFVSGRTYNDIAERLERNRVPSPSGLMKWHISTIKSILTNEKYKGDALLRKSYSVDFLSKRRKNEGQVESIYVEDCMPVIIPKELSEIAAMEVKKRKGERGGGEDGNGKYSSQYTFSGKLYCGHCGSKLRRHCQWNGEKRTPVWTCIEKQKSKNKACQIKPVKESTIEQAFTDTVKKLFTEKERLMSLLKTNIESNITSLKSEQLIELENKISENSEYLLKIYKDYQNGKLSKENYFKQFEEKSALSEKLLSEKNNIKEGHYKSVEDKKRIEDILKFLDGKPDLDNFDSELFKGIIQKVVIYDSENINFEIKGGYNLQL